MSCGYSLQSYVFTGHSVGYALNERVQTELNAPYDLTHNNRSLKQLRAHFDCQDQSSRVVMLSPYIRYQGLEVSVESFSVSSDERSPYWLARIELADPLSLNRLELGEQIELVLPQVSFVLRIDGRALSRSAPSNVRLSITAISPLAWLAPPHGLPVSRSWAEPVWASEAVAELLAGLESDGTAIDWQLENWLIPPGKLQAIQANPLELVSQIVATAGGLLESLPDGGLRVRHLFPLTPVRYGESIPALTVSDHDVFEWGDADELRPDYDRIRISDGSSLGRQDQIEYVADEHDRHSGLVHVIPQPWRVITLAHTGNIDTRISACGIVELTETELLEFKAGRASSRYPIDELISMRWQYAELGPISIATDGRTLSTLTTVCGGYSLAQVHYRTRAYTFQVQHPQQESIQFLVLEGSEGSP
ncbi:hypothetical protein [Chitinibacter sp. GC72]|uniref:hypothetical protein n=1 Tax=Chitinibacter sp. GC72 TaxID=1526917 RepID=UPI0012F8EB39|nr:hypothetical protein [Chitinibacter sp. GC72]